MSHEKNQAKALLEIWTVLVRFRWRFIVPAFAVMALVLGAGMLLPRKYKAEAIFEQTNDMVLEELTESPYGATSKFQTPQRAIVEEVAGELAIDALRPGLDPLFQDGGLHDNRASFYRDLSRRIVVRKQHYDRGDQIHIEYVGTNPTRARLVVNTLVENYIERTRAAMESRLKKSAEFFEQETATIRTRIEELENLQLQFEIKHDQLLPDAATGIQTMLNEQYLALSDLQAKRDTAEERVRVLSDEMERTPAIVPQVVRGPNPVKARLREQLQEAQTKLATFLNTLKMTERHPDLINLRQQIATLTRSLEGTPDEVVTHTQEGQNPKRAELELKLADARAEAGDPVGEDLSGSRRVPGDHAAGDGGLHAPELPGDAAAQGEPGDRGGIGAARRTVRLHQAVRPADAPGVAEPVAGAGGRAGAGHSGRRAERVLRLPHGRVVHRWRGVDAGVRPAIDR